MWKDKAVLVTGASSGIGVELALILAGRGARLALLARRLDKLNEVADRCAREGTRPLVVQADVSRRADCERAIEEARAGLGGLDCLILNAGIDTHADFLDLPPDQADAIVRTNLLGPIDLTRAALPHLKAGCGAVGVVSSLQGKTGFPGSAVYAGTKHALHGFFDSLRMELQGTGVSVTLVCPGGVESGIRPAGGHYDRSMLMPTRTCAEIVVRAVEQRRREEILTLAGKLGVMLRPFLPGLVDSIVRRSLDRFYGPGSSASS